MAINITIGNTAQYEYGRPTSSTYGVAVGLTHTNAYPGAPGPGPLNPTAVHVPLQLRCEIIPQADCRSITLNVAYSVAVNNAAMVAAQTYHCGLGTENAMPTSGYSSFVWDTGNQCFNGLVINGSFQAGKTYYVWFFSDVNLGGYVRGFRIVRASSGGAVFPPYVTASVSAYSSGDADVGDTSPVVTAYVVTEDGADVSYKWYSNGALVSESGASYAVQTTNSGVFSVYCDVTASKNNTTASAQSKPVKVTIYSAAPISISSQPKSATYTQNSTANALLVSITSNGNAHQRVGETSYQWYKDGSPILGATGTSYTPSTSVTGASRYSCSVKNVVGTTQTSVTSNAVTINVVAQTPVITTQPVSSTYRQGEPAMALTVAATVGTGSLSYQWYKQGSRISGATNSTCAVDTSDMGTFEYYCIVTNTSGNSTASATSQTAQIVVETPTPVFTHTLTGASYVVGASVNALNGTALAYVGTLSYQWYKQIPGEAAQAIPGATSATYTPDNSVVGTFIYYVIATNVSNGVTYRSRSETAEITFVNAFVTEAERYQAYLKQLKTNFTKVVRADFLNPDGSIAFSLDGQYKNKRSNAFIESGDLSVNLQNGTRRQANITLSNVDNAFDYAVNKIWFGQEIRLSEGLILPDGSEYLIPQGVFHINTPQEDLRPNQHTMTYPLVDKWAYLDGTLFGNLEGAYEVFAGTNIFDAMQSLLKLDRFTMNNNGGSPVDRLAPIFTEWYNNKVQTLTDGSQVSLVDSPYDLLVDGDSGTLASILTGLSDMLAAWIGYNPVGRLVIDPSQDDVLDSTKPVEWAFEPTETQLLGATYSIRNTEVYNDIIVVGATTDDYVTARGRAQNLNPASDTCISRIGLKTLRISKPDFYSNQVCEDYAAWLLKRYAILTKAVTIESTQLFHIQENSLVTVRRPDKDWAVERHLVMGYTRPLSGRGTMKLNVVSCNDLLDVATIVK